MFMYSRSPTIQLLHHGRNQVESCRSICRSVWQERKYTASGA